MKFFNWKTISEKSSQLPVTGSVSEKNYISTSIE